MSLLLAAILCCSPPQSSPPRVVIRTSPAAGLGLEEGVSRRDPSDVIKIGERDYVFYAKVQRGAPLYPASLTGSIWYATSEDQGHTWTERGVVLEPSEKKEAFDRRGVFDPNVLRGADGDLLLYYCGIDQAFNFRFERAQNLEPIRVGIARLELDESGAVVGAERLRQGLPILEPQPQETRHFDSLRIEAPSPILRDGTYQLYYRGRAELQGADRPGMGLATAELPDGEYVHAYDGWAVLPLGDEVCVWPHQQGTLALVTQAHRGLYFAADGVHFSRIIDRVAGRLNDPGVHRGGPRAQARSNRLWGVHVARLSPDPFLERFEIEFPKKLPQPLAATIPTPSAESRASAAGWRGGGTWLDQHEDILTIAATRPQDYVFLGDSITQSWGGPGRDVGAPGAEAWQRYFGDKDAANYGISGDRTQHLLWRIDHGAFQNARCRVVVLLVGTNNLGDDPPAAIAAGVEAILERLECAVPTAKVLLLGLLPRGELEDDPMRVQVRLTNQLLSEMRYRPGVEYLDLEDRFVDEQGRARAALYAADLLHLSPAGYEVWGGAVAPILDRL